LLDEFLLYLFIGFSRDLRAIQLKNKERRKEDDYNTLHSIAVFKNPSTEHH